MILGIGTDLVELDRMKKILQSSTADSFVRRVLTEAECRIANIYSGRRRWEFTAGRFAAKEAVVKALGCGIGAMAGFQDIEILPDRLGKPVCLVSSHTYEKLCLPADEMKVHLSITHSKALASAYAVIERND